MLIPRDRNLRLLFAAITLWMVGIALYDGLIPIYARQLGASPVELGTLFTLKNLALAGGFLIGLMMADRISRRRQMLISWLIGLPVPLMLAAAPTYLWLLPGILLYELTFFALPAIYAYITERVPSSELASAFAAMGSVTSIGFLVSPTVGGIIADRFGIRVVLLLAFVFFVLSALLVARLESGGPGALPASRGERLRTADLIPIAPPLLVYVGVTFMILVTVPFLPPYLREVRGLSLAEIGVLSSLQALGAVLLTPFVGRFGDRLGRGRTMVGQLGVWAAGIVMTAYGSFPVLLVGAMLRCRAPLHTLSQAMLGARAPAAIIGRAFALAGVLSAVMSAAGSFIGGYAYRVDPVYPLFISIGTGAVLAVALLVRLSRA
jgi:DHA1 family multidrug resistance protein-like MFS transporter